VYECKIWSLTLREECSLKVFENRVLKRILGPKRQEVAGAREECVIKSRMSEIGGACSTCHTEFWSET
jgi:cytochrome c556